MTTTYEHLDRGWVRYDDPSDRGIHVANQADTSRQHHNPYDSRCSWCYFGYPHTTDAHLNQILKNREN